jgi:cobalamin-dependent methionine synthase I
MTFMVETVQDATRMKLILDSPDPEILARGLAVCREKPVLNALSLERHKIEGILPLAAEHGTRLVLLLMDERSRVPLSMEERIAIAVELRELALSAGLQDKDLIYDPVMPNLSWPDAEHHVREIVKTIRMLSGFSLFPEPAQTMIGLSNLRSGLRKKYPIELETTILALLAGSGLNIVLADVIQNGFIKEYNKIKPFCET